MPTLILNKKQVLELLNMSEVITVVEQAFRDLAERQRQHAAKSIPVRGEGRLPGDAGVFTGSSRFEMGERASR